MKSRYSPGTLFAVLLVPVAVSTAGLTHWIQDSEDTAQRLPGARNVIRAAEYPSIQDAIDALPPEGGVVQIPPGRFDLKEPLRISSEDVTLVGVGSSTHLHNVSMDGAPTIVIAHPDLQNARTDNKTLWRIRIADMRITGSPESGHGIEAKRINEIFIDGVTISDHGGDGIRLDHCYEDPRICDSLITYNDAVGLNLLGCHDIVVSANQFEENKDALHCIDGFNLTMTGNALDDHLGRGVVIENTYGSVVTGNMIEECHAAAVTLDRDCYGITISANVIAHNGAGVDLRDAHGCSVSANTFTLMTSDALSIGPNSGRIAVTGNSFCNSYIGDGQIKRATDDAEAAGLVLNSTEDIGISGNVFSSLTTKAIEVDSEDSTRILLDGNLFTDVESDHESLPQEGQFDTIYHSRNSR